MRSRYYILLSFLLLLFISIPTTKANSDLNVEWIWDKELRQAVDNNLIIRVRNDNTFPITLKTIVIHYPWVKSNIFDLFKLAEIIQPSKTFDIKILVSIPRSANIGETSDFACVIEYNIDNSTKILSTGVVRCTQTIYIGKHINISQTIDPTIIYAITIFFIVSCVALYSSKETIISLLYKHKQKIPVALFIFIFIIYSLSLYTNFFSYIYLYTYFLGFAITGDETHYILATKGLLEGTTNPTVFYLKNFNYHTIISDGVFTKGQEIFSHMYGLPAMSMIPYKLGELFLGSGTAGCLSFISLLVSLIIVFIYKISMSLSNNNIIPSLLTSLAFAFSTLLFVWSGQFFTEIAASFFIISFITLIITSDNPSGWFLGGLSLGILPFLKFQFIFVSVSSIILAIFLLKSRKPELKAFLISSVTITITILLYMYLFIGFKAYGSGLLIYPVDIGVKTFNLFGLQVNKLFYLSWLGLLLDRNVGMLFYSPILILSALGVFQLFKTKNIAIYFALLILIVWGGSVSVTTFWNGWLAPPGRYMIVVLPLFSLPFIMGITSFYKNKKYMYSFVTLFLLGLIPNLLMATNRLLDYVMSSNYGGGIIRFMEALAKLKVNISVFPEFFDGMWTGQNIQYAYIWSICFIILTSILLFISYKHTKEMLK